MGKIHERFKTRVQVSISETQRLKMKEHYIDSLSKGLVKIFAQKTDNPLTLDKTKPIAELIEESSQISAGHLTYEGYNEVESLNMHLRLLSCKVHDLCKDLGIDDSDPSLRQFVKTKMDEMTIEVAAEMQRYFEHELMNQALAARTPTGTSTVPSGFGGLDLGSSANGGPVSGRTLH